MKNLDRGNAQFPSGGGALVGDRRMSHLAVSKSPGDWMFRLWVDSERDFLSKFTAKTDNCRLRALHSISKICESYLPSVSIYLFHEMNAVVVLRHVTQASTERI